ncbi:MAG TPA: DUF6152 family protein [Caulobacteraceae bacterium]|jgi:hypothetical protein|nr:DUF6152 family protein [Caulobacteraceae bacterium]
MKDSQKPYGAAILAVVGTALMAFPAHAHHSQAMFDQSKDLTIEGAVQELQWTNPHSWLVVHVGEPGGASVNWQLEMGPPGKLSRVGMKRNTFKPGDKVTVRIHPMRDGRAGGQIVTLTGPDGHSFDDVR